MSETGAAPKRALLTLPETLLKTGGLEVVREIPRSNRDSPLMSSPLWKFIAEKMDQAQKQGVCPFEQILKITPKHIPELKAYKDPRTTVMSALRKTIRKRKLGKILELVVRGDTLYLQGVE